MILIIWCLCFAIRKRNHMNSMQISNVKLMDFMVWMGLLMRWLSMEIGEMGSDDRVTGSSNFGRFINYLHTENDAWIERINFKLEG